MAVDEAAFLIVGEKGYSPGHIIGSGNFLVFVVLQKGLRPAA